MCFFLKYFLLSILNESVNLKKESSLKFVRNNYRLLNFLVFNSLETSPNFFILVCYGPERVWYYKRLTVIKLLFHMTDLTNGCQKDDS